MSAPCDVAAFGEHAVLISSDRSLIGYRSGLEQFGHVRIGMNSLLIDGVDPREAIRLIEEHMAGAVPEDGSTNSHHHTIWVDYDGEDLSRVADFLQISVEAVVAAHCSLEWRVAMLGFSPGFAYLTTVEPNPFAQLPRLEKPRSKVAAGSVGVVAGMSAIYPSESPGGWLLIGSSDVVLFDAAARPPSLLSSGDVVTFVAR